MPKKRLKGKVISTKMNKTVVVEVEQLKEFSKYKRKYKTHKKYKAHDGQELCREGDKVTIEESRPYSKEKRWKVIRVEHQDIVRDIEDIGGVEGIKDEKEVEEADAAEVTEEEKKEEHNIGN